LNNPGASTPTASANGGATAIGDKFDVPLSSGTASASITATDVQTSVASGVNAKGQYLIVYFSLTTGATGGAFDFTTFTVSDSDGKSYQADAAASDAYLKTSPDLPDGTSTALDANTTYTLAVVYDVPTTASGFTLTTPDGSTTVTLDR